MVIFPREQHTDVEQVRYRAISRIENNGCPPPHEGVPNQHELIDIVLNNTSYLHPIQSGRVETFSQADKNQIVIGYLIHGINKK